MIAIIIRFFVLLRTKKIIRTILNVIHKNQKQLLLDMIQDITSINGGAIPNSCSLFKIGSPIDVRQINMPHKRDRIARRKTSGKRMNTLALKNRGRYLRQRMPGNGKYIDIDTEVVEGSFHGHEARLLPADRRECRRKILSSIRLERDRSSNRDRIKIV